MRYFRIGLLSFIIAWILILSVNAHEVGMRADVQARSASGARVTYSATTLPVNAQIISITITVIYSTREPMAHGRIQIYAPDRSDIPWRVGRLDAEGEYQFTPDLSRRGRWTIRVESEGHTNFMNLVI